MKINSRFVKILLAGLSSVLFIIVIVFLVRWTNRINTKKKAKEFEATLDEIIETYGEKGLLEMAGVSVKEVLYGDDGIIVLEGDDESWSYTSDEIINIKIYEKCKSAVVHISTSTSDVSSFLDAEPDNGVGSGFFVSEDGYICTNEHVIEGASEITVTTADNKVYDAVLVGTDPENDIAVLKIEGEEDFPYLTFQSSDELVVGQKVLAIGNPFGYDRTLTTGIISGLSRPLRDEDGQVLLGMIQTDAQINPGNSGGPLLNTSGNVIGVCTSIYTSSGFAVSSNSASAAVSDIISYGKVNRGWLDIVPVVLTPSIVEYASLKVDQGILISQVVSGGKAEIAGLKGGNKQVRYGSSVIFLGGDVITKINDMSVSDFSDMFTALSTTRPGDIVTVEINRNGSTLKIKVELVERTAELVGYTNR